MSAFTVNLGPPGPWKLVFIGVAVAVDIVGYTMRVHAYTFWKSPPAWKLIVTFTPFPVGLLVGAWFALEFFHISLPMIEKGPKFAFIGVGFLWVMGAAATWAAHRIFVQKLRETLSEE